jgi:hypothetical protein
MASRFSLSRSSPKGERSVQGHPESSVAPRFRRLQTGGVNKGRLESSRAKSIECGTLLASSSVVHQSQCRQGCFAETACGGLVGTGVGAGVAVPSFGLGLGLGLGLGFDRVRMIGLG